MALLLAVSFIIYLLLPKIVNIELIYRCASNVSGIKLVILDSVVACDESGIQHIETMSAVLY